MASFEQWYKFYLSEWTNKYYPTPKGHVFIKAGITHHIDDAYKRFDPSVDDGYPKNYEDWNIVIKNSLLFKSKALAEQYEKYFLTELYPYDYNLNKVWVEDALMLERYHYSHVSGISEVRMIPISEAKQLYQKLHHEKHSQKKGFENA